MTDVSTAWRKFEKEKALLSETRKISKTDCADPLWASLKSQYRRTTLCPIQRAALSIQNACLHQKRLVLLLTRDDTQSLVRADKNHRKAARGTAFEDAAWKTLLAFLNKAGILKTETVADQTCRKAGMYIVACLDIQKALADVSYSDQLLECSKMTSKKVKTAVPPKKPHVDVPAPEGKSPFESLLRSEWSTGATR